MSPLASPNLRPDECRGSLPLAAVSASGWGAGPASFALFARASQGSGACGPSSWVPRFFGTLKMTEDLKKRMLVGFTPLDIYLIRKCLVRKIYVF